MYELFSCLNANDEHQNSGVGAPCIYMEPSVTHGLDQNELNETNEYDILIFTHIFMVKAKSMYYNE